MRLFLTIVVVALSTLTALSQTKNRELSPQQKVQSLYLDGINELLANNNSEGAAVILLDVLRMDSLHAPSLYYLSLLANNTEEAREYAQRAVKYDSQNIWYLTNLASIYARSNQFDKAIEVAQKCVELSPKDIAHQQMMISLLTDAKEYDKAIEKLNEFESKFGQNEESFVNRLRIYETMEPTLEIAKELESLAKENKTNITPLLMASDIYLRLNDTNKAIEVTKQAEAIDSTNWRVIVLLTDSYLQTNNIPKLFKYTVKLMELDMLKVEAKIDFINNVIFNQYLYQNHPLEVSRTIMALQKSYPRDSQVGHLVAQHFFQMGLIEQAEEHYMEMIREGYASIETYYNLIGLLNYLKRYEDVISVCDQATAAYPETVIDNTMQKAYAMMELDRHNEALSTLRSTIKLLGKGDKLTLSSLYGLMGDIEYDQGNSSQSYKSYDKAIKLDPKNYGTLNNYSYYLSLENRELKKAQKMMEVVLEADPDNATYIDTYGWILYLEGNYPEAEKQLARAVELDTTKSADIFMHYGDVLFKVGKNIMAKVYWRKAEQAGANPEEVKQRMSW